MKLQTLVEQYITFQQSIGLPFRANAKALRAFCRAIGSRVDIADVRPKQINGFVWGGGPRTWYTKLAILRPFYRYAISRGYVAATPLPKTIPQRPPPFVPYIYSHEELRRLVELAGANQCRRTRLEPITMRTILLLLYGTGLRVGEALNLNGADVDLVDSLITVRGTKFGKTRFVPFGPILGPVLTQYAARRLSPEVQAPFFATRIGARVQANTLQRKYRLLCARAGISRPGGARCQPRLHDLRHTFAVHRLTSWYQQGADAQRLLPLLSVYLGHVCLANTQIYLTMTGDLLHEAGKRFEHYAQKEQNRD